MIDRSHALPLTRQARELGMSRGSVYYLPKPVSVADLGTVRRIDELHMEFPFAGSRMLRDLLLQEGIKVGRLHVTRPSRPQAAILAKSENVLGTWHSVLTMEIIEEDSSLHHREWVDGSEYSGRGFDRTMEPELCRY